MSATSSAARSSTPSATSWASSSAPHPPLPADDRHAAQRQGGGLPALHGPARRRPLRGQLRDGVHTVDVVRPDAPDGQGEPAQVRRHAAVPRAHRLHGPVQALRRRGAALRGGHRLRARGVQPGRGPPERQARRHRRLRAHRSCSAAWPPRPRRSTSRYAAGASGWRNACGSWSCCKRGGDADRPSYSGTRRCDDEDLEDLEDAPDDEVEAAEEADPRPGHGRAHDRRAQARDRDPAEPGGARAAGPPQRRRHASGASWPACSARSSRRPDAATTRRSPPTAPGRSRPDPVTAQKLVIFTEHRDTLTYLDDRDHDAARAAGRRRHHPRRHGPRGAPAGPGGLQARPRRPGPARHRRRRRGHQPPARPPDGQLRPALEPQPDRAALRPHPPHRPDRGLPPLEPGGRRDPRGRRLPAPPREARGRHARRSAARSSTSWASSSSRASPCATC